MTAFLRAFLALPLVLGLAACQDADDTTVVSRSDVSDAPPPASASADTSTPEATVQSFLQAVQQRDAAAMTALLSDQAAGEFDVLRTGDVTPAELDELADLFAGAQVGGHEQDGDLVGVNVVGGQRDETIWVAQGPSGWGIVDF